MSTPLSARPSQPLRGDFCPSCPGTWDGRYALIERVELLSFGALYEARDTTTGRPVTLTIVHPAWVAPPHGARNKGRVHAAQAFRHARLSPMLRAAVEHDPVYIVSGGAPGQPLPQWRREAGDVALDDVYRLLAQLISVVEAVHAEGGLLGALTAESVRVLDGAIQVLHPFHLEAPPEPPRDLPPLRTAWLAPEQLYDVAPLGPATDVYGVGMALGFLLACGMTEPGHSLMVQGIEVSPPVDEIYVRATSRQPELRYATIGELRDALAAAAGEAWAAAARTEGSLPGATGRGDEDVSGSTVEDPGVPASVTVDLVVLSDDDAGDEVEGALVVLDGGIAGPVLDAEVLGPDSAPPPLPAEDGEVAEQARPLAVMAAVMPPPLPGADGDGEALAAWPVPEAHEIQLVDGTAEQLAVALAEATPRPSRRPSDDDDTSERLALAAGGASWTIDARDLSHAVRTGRSIDDLVTPVEPERQPPVRTGGAVIVPAPSMGAAPDAVLPTSGVTTRPVPSSAPPSQRGSARVWLAAALFLAAGVVVALLLFSGGSPGTTPGGGVVAVGAGGGAHVDHAGAEHPPAEAAGVVAADVAVLAMAPDVSGGDDAGEPLMVAGADAAVLAQGDVVGSDGAAVAVAGADAAAGDQPEAGEDVVVVAAGLGASTEGTAAAGAVAAGDAGEGALGEGEAGEGGPGDGVASVDGPSGAGEGETAGEAPGTDAPEGPATEADTADAKPAFVATDWQAYECPNGMARIRRKVKRRLPDGATADDYDVWCVDRHEYPGAGSQPKVNVGLAEAKAACAGRGKRLCTRAEWRGACGGKYPYGGAYQPGACNTVGDDYLPRPLTASGGKSGCKSGWGTYDMVGNVAEWTADGYVNGGSAYKNGEDGTCSHASRRAGGHPYVGFRCCADATGPE